MHLGARAGPAGGKKPDAKKPGGLVIPKPINLPSRRKENHGFDPGVSLVPTGTTGSWLSSGARPGVAVPAGVPLGTAGAYPGPFRPGAGPQAVAPPRAGAPGGWGASASSGGNAAAAVGGRGPSGGDFPELGGPAKPANPWKAPTPARSADDLRSRMGGAAGGAGSVAAAGDGWGNGRDWAEEAEDQPMDFRRPVVVEKESGGASRTASASASTIPSASTAPAGSIAVPFSATSALSSQSDSAGSMQRVDPREEARMLALRKQMELEKQAEQQQKATEQQRRQEREAAERLQRQEQEEQERRRRESEEQRLAQEEARRRAMEQADQERRRSEQERRLYEARERTWQDDQRRRVDEQRRMQQLQEQAQQQQQQQQQQLGSQDQVRSQLLTQEATMRQASEAAKLRRQQEEELERQRERERERAARIRLEELDRKRNGALGPASLGGDSVMRPPVVVRSAWGSTDSVGVGAGGAGNVLGSGAGLLEVDYAAMPRGRGAAPKEPRKLYDHKTDKFVSEDEKAWKGLNRPPTADKGASKGSSEKSNNALAVSSGKDSRSSSHQASAGTSGSKEHEGMSRAALKKLALEERRRREREGRINGDDDDDLPMDAKAGDKNPPAKRLLAREHDREGKGGGAGRNTTAVGILGADGGASMRGNWLADVPGGLGSEELAALATSSDWDLFGRGQGKSMGASLGLHDGDMGGMFKMEDTNNVATGAADFILEGDDEFADGMGMEDLDDNDGSGVLIDDSSFNTPAGWAPAATREAWAGEQNTGSAAWDTNALSQGSAVNIEKAFGAFNGMGYSLSVAQNNLVWSGTMMGVGHDVGSTWQLNDDGLNSSQRLALPQGWSAPPPDSFQPAGDEDDVAQGHGGRRGGVKGQRTRNGGGRKNRGATAQTAGAADANSNVSEDVQVAESQSAPRSGRSGGRAQSGSTRSKRGGVDKGGKGHSQAEADAARAAGGGSRRAVLLGAEFDAAGPGAGEKEGSSDKGGSSSGGRSSRGKMRAAAKVVAVPANIRQAAQDHIVKQRDAVSAPDAPQ